MRLLGAIGVAVVLAPAMATGSAQASWAGTTRAAGLPTVINGIYQNLTMDPNSGMVKSEGSREIFLAGLDYGWYTYVSPAAIPAPPSKGECKTYTGPIASGWYIWTVTLYPSDDYYRFFSKLSGKYNGVDYQISCPFKLPASGWYTWGSALDPHD